MKKEIAQIVSLFLLGLVCFFQTLLVVFGHSTGVGPLAMITVLVLCGTFCEFVAFTEVRRLRVNRQEKASE